MCLTENPGIPALLLLFVICCPDHAVVTVKSQESVPFFPWWYLVVVHVVSEHGRNVVHDVHLSE